MMAQPIHEFLPINLSVDTFLSYFADSENVSARPLVRPGYDDKYRSINYRFVERQKLSPKCQLAADIELKF